MRNESILQKSIECNNKYYCPYCGKELIKDVEIEDYEEYVSYFCNCEDAKKNAK